MGQKVDPRWFRVGFSKPHPTEWMAKTKGDTATFFLEDIAIRKAVDEFYKRASIAKVVIRKTKEGGEILIFTGKPALIVGKQGKRLDEFTKYLKSKIGRELKILVKEVKNPELSARILSEYAAEQLEKRMPYRRVAKGTLSRAMSKGAVGVKIQISGRLNGVELSRSEQFLEGRIPLQTLRADVDYHYTTAKTKYGILGVKVWVYKWDILERRKTAR